MSSFKDLITTETGRALLVSTGTGEPCIVLTSILCTAYKLAPEL